MDNEQINIEENERINVIVIGTQHAGKSSFLNSLDRKFNNAKIPKFDSGRIIHRCTYFYEQIKILINNYHFHFYDTSGRGFDDPLSQWDKSFIRKIITGINPKDNKSVNIASDEFWPLENIDNEHRSQFVFLMGADDFIVNVRTIVPRVVQREVQRNRIERHGIFNLQQRNVAYTERVNETVNEDLMEPRVQLEQNERISFMPELYNFFHHELKNKTDIDHN